MTFKRTSLESARDGAAESLASVASNDVDELARLEEQFLGSFRREAPFDSLDVIAAGLAGAVAAAVDLLLVAIPKDVTYLGRHPQRGSILTRLLKRWQTPTDNDLGSRAHVPFDNVANGRRVAGMWGGNHRFMTPGHDPLIGILVGVHDIVRGGRTAIGVDGVLRFDRGFAEPSGNVAAALVIEVLHLLSDVATKQGLPAPFMTLAGLLRVGSFGERDRTVADLARYMYEQGYDLRHFLVSCSAPVASRVLLVGYFIGRRYFDPNYRAATDATARRNTSVLAHPTLDRLTLYADALACAANAGKVALYQGNPSALNLGQWTLLFSSAAKHLNSTLERPTEVLLDRSAANEKALAARWRAVQQALDLNDVDLQVAADDAF